MSGTSELELLEGEGEETLFESSYVAGDEEERRFDEVIAALEDVVMSPSFRDPITLFCRDNCRAFVPGVDENSLEQHALFSQYEELTEARIEQELAIRIPGFEMTEFEEMLVKPGRTEALSGDVLDLLMAFGDFDEFKSTMLSYREQVEFEAAKSHSVGAKNPLETGVEGALLYTHCDRPTSHEIVPNPTVRAGLVTTPASVPAAGALPPGVPPTLAVQGSFAAPSGGMLDLTIVGRGSASLGGSAVPSYAGMGPTVTSLRSTGSGRR